MAGPTRRIAVTNLKGGSGKTTTAVNLADCLSRSGRTVLLVDVDPQASASHWLLGAGAVPGPFIEDVLAGEARARAAVRPTPVERLALLPASAHLGARARRLAGETAAELVLSGALEELAGYDYILFDCPPELGLLALNALLASDEVLIPVPPEPMAVEGLGRVFATVETLASRYRRPLRVTTVVPVRVRLQTLLARQVLTLLRSRFPQTTPGQVRETVYAAEAPGHHLPIVAYRPECSAAADYGELARHVLAQEGSAV